MGLSDYVRTIRAKIGAMNLLCPGVAAVIRNEHGELLLQNKGGDVWSLPAGMIEPGETPKEAVKREVLEETGLVVEPVKLLGVFGGPAFRVTYPNGHEVEYTDILMQCRVLEDTGVISDDETAYLQYVSKPNMPNLGLPYPLELLFDETNEAVIY